jgi:cephalosporin hydroxylase
MSNQWARRGRTLAGRVKRRSKAVYVDQSAALRRKREKENPLEAYFRANQGRLVYKWMHYFEIYHRHFAPFRGKQVTVLEFGVFQGGSLQMWKDYFGPRVRVIGVDIDKRCARFAERRIKIVIGDQEDRAFLRRLAKKYGPFDVVIEDGGHRMDQQINTFEEIWPAVADGGVFLIEDLHTSYWPSYGGGHRREGTFIEYAKNLIDQQNGWYSRDTENFDVDEYTRTIRGMHVYDSIIVFDKGQVSRPSMQQTGTRSF